MRQDFGEQWAGGEREWVSKLGTTDSYPRAAKYARDGKVCISYFYFVPQHTRSSVYYCGVAPSKYTSF